MDPLETLADRAAGPERVALVAGTRSWTYQRLETEVDHLARALRARGVGPGDRVVLHMSNRLELVAAFYACWRTGAVAVPLSTRFKAPEMRSLLEQLRPAVYLGQSDLHPRVADLEADVLPAQACYLVDGEGDGGPARSWQDLLAEVSSASLPTAVDPGAPAVLMTTSGTTGRPKFVAHTPATLAAMVQAVSVLPRDATADGPTDPGGRHVAVYFTPLAHGSGLFTLLRYMALGVPVVLLEGFDADAVLDAVQAHRGTWILGLPFMFAELLRCQAERPREVSSLQLCDSGGDVCPPGLQEAVQDAFGVPLRSYWGATEASGVMLPGVRPGPFSQVGPLTRVRLVDAGGDPVPADQPGALELSAPCVAPGYWVGPGRLQPLSADGWFPTGDLMRWSGPEELMFVSRVKDLIVRAGTNISPLEVEEALRTHPAVRDAAVLGVPDEVLGQRLAALVVLDDAAGEAAAVLAGVRAALLVALADHKVPERLVAVEAVPRNPAGKIDRTALPAVLAAA